MGGRWVGRGQTQYSVEKSRENERNTCGESPTPPTANRRERTLSGKRTATTAPHASCLSNRGEACSDHTHVVDHPFFSSTADTRVPGAPRGQRASLWDLHIKQDKKRKGITEGIAHAASPSSSRASGDGRATGKDGVGREGVRGSDGGVGAEDAHGCKQQARQVDGGAGEARLRVERSTKNERKASGGDDGQLRGPANRTSSGRNSALSARNATGGCVGGPQCQRPMQRRASARARTALPQAGTAHVRDEAGQRRGQRPTRRAHQKSACAAHEVTVPTPVAHNLPSGIRCRGEPAAGRAGGSNLAPWWALPPSAHSVSAEPSRAKRHGTADIDVSLVHFREVVCCVVLRLAGEGPCGKETRRRARGRVSAGAGQGWKKPPLSTLRS